MKRIVNLPMYIEIGACRDSTIELISLGLARELAIELVENCKIDDKDIINSLRCVEVEKISNKYVQKRLKEFIVECC